MQLINYRSPLTLTSKTVVLFSLALLCFAEKGKRGEKCTRSTFTWILRAAVSEVSEGKEKGRRHYLQQHTCFKLSESEVACITEYLVTVTMVTHG